MGKSSGLSADDGLGYMLRDFEDYPSDIKSYSKQ